MNKQIKDIVKENCIKDYPNESCGLVCFNFESKKFKVIKCENEARDKRNKFQISSVDFLNATTDNSEIIAIYHSHCFDYAENKLNFSHQDVISCNEIGIPFLLYIIPDNKWNYIEPEDYQHKPLLGRTYLRGVWDCFTLVRDWYKDHNVYLPYYFPPENDSFYEYDLIDENIENNGFYKVDFKDIKYGDTLLFNIKNSKNINHLGVYLGGSKILHQPLGILSNQQDFDIRLMKYLKGAIRHKDFRL